MRCDLRGHVISSLQVKMAHYVWAKYKTGYLYKYRQKNATILDSNISLDDILFALLKY